METVNNSIQFKIENYATENAGIWATNLQINPYGSLGRWLYEIQTAITSAFTSADEAHGGQTKSNTLQKHVGFSSWGCRTADKISTFCAQL